MCPQVDHQHTLMGSGQLGNGNNKPASTCILKQRSNLLDIWKLEQCLSLSRLLSIAVSPVPCDITHVGEKKHTHSWLKVHC